MILLMHSNSILDALVELLELKSKDVNEEQYQPLETIVHLISLIIGQEDDRVSKLRLRWKSIHDK